MVAGLAPAPRVILPRRHCTNAYFLTCGGHPRQPLQQPSNFELPGSVPTQPTGPCALNSCSRLSYEDSLLMLSASQRAAPLLCCRVCYAVPVQAAQHHLTQFGACQVVPVLWLVVRYLSCLVCLVACTLHEAYVSQWQHRSTTSSLASPSGKPPTIEPGTLKQPSPLCHTNHASTAAQVQHQAH